MCAAKVAQRPPCENNAALQLNVGSALDWPDEFVDVLYAKHYADHAPSLKFSVQ